MHIEKIAVAGKTIEITRYHNGRYGIKGVQRGKNIATTKESQEAVNRRRAEERLRLLLNENFGPGDFHLSLNYIPGNRPQDAEEMKKDAERFLRRMRAAFRREGREMKYIHVMEVGARGARHHHIVINHIDTKTVQKYWDKGRVHIHPLDESGQYRQLASYLIKYSDRMLHEDGRLMGKRWYASRNLRQPKVTRRIIKSKTIRPDPTPRRGYYIDQDTVRYGVSGYNGYPYLTYTLVRIKEDKHERRLGRQGPHNRDV